MGGGKESPRGYTVLCHQGRTGSGEGRVMKDRDHPQIVT